MTGKHSQNFWLTLLALLVMSAAGGCKEKIEINAAWNETEIAVDGSSTDWAELSTRFFPEQGAVVGMANNSNTLHLLLRISDARMAEVIKRTGLTLDFQTEAKEHNEYTLTFRGGPTPEQVQKILGTSPDGNEAGRPGGGPEGGLSGGPQSRGDQRLFTCAIKDRLTQKDIPPDGSEGPRAAFGIDHSLFCYEFAIPLDAGGVRSYGLGISPGSKLNLTAVWGDTEGMRPAGGKGGRPGGGRPGGMGSGMPGGGGPGGGRAGRQRPDMPKKQEVVFKLTLADGPGEAVEGE